MNDATQDIDTTVGNDAPGSAPADVIELSVIYNHAQRTITRSEISIDAGRVVVTETIEDFKALAEWNADFLTRGFYEDIRDYDARDNEVVRLLIDTATVTSHTKTMPIEEWSQYADVQGLTYKTKTKAVLNYLDKIYQWLGEVRTIQTTELVSAQARLRQLQTASPTPHGETNEMTLGSTAEQTLASQAISAIVARIEDLMTKVFKNVDKLNQKVGHKDTGWRTQLPDIFAKLSEYNAAQPQEPAE